MADKIKCPDCGRVAGRDITHGHCSATKVPECTWLNCVCGTTYDRVTRRAFNAEAAQ